MTVPTSQIEQYFDDVLAERPHIKPWQPNRRLPPILRQYELFNASILGNECLLMIDPDAARTAATVQKHVEQLRNRWDHDGEVIYLREQITALDRMRLIERRIPFVVPGNQMFLPMLGIDLREHFRRVRNAAPKLSPASQAAVLLLLNEAEARTYDAKQLAKRLGYSRMTASRSLGELESHDLEIVHKEGRKRVIGGTVDKQLLWNLVQPLLDAPVSHRRLVRQLPSEFYIKGGLTALSLYSMLSPSKRTVFAMGADEWKAASQDRHCEQTDENDPEAIEVEVWKYDPRLLATNDDMHACDPFSLYLSLKEHKDERVQSCLAEMMKEIEW